MTQTTGRGSECLGTLLVVAAALVLAAAAMLSARAGPATSEPFAAPPRGGDRKVCAELLIDMLLLSATWDRANNPKSTFAAICRGCGISWNAARGLLGRISPGARYVLQHNAWRPWQKLPNMQATLRLLASGGYGNVLAWADRTRRCAGLPRGSKVLGMASQRMRQWQVPTVSPKGVRTVTFDGRRYRVLDEPGRSSAEARWRFSGQSGALPISVSFRHEMLPVRNQEDEGSCSAFASAAVLEHAFGLRDARRDSHLSPWFLYDMRCARGCKTPGAWRGDMFRVAQFYGACLEPKYYRKSYDHDAPSYNDMLRDHRAAVKDAEKRRVSRVWSVLDVDSIRAWLAGRGPPRAARPLCVNVSIVRIEKSRMLIRTNRLEKSIGGHSLVLVGYTRDHFLARNSWGKEWGDGGYFLLPVADLRKALENGTSAGCTGVTL